MRPRSLMRRLRPDHRGPPVDKCPRRKNCGKRWSGFGASLGAKVGIPFVSFLGERFNLVYALGIHFCRIMFAFLQAGADWNMCVCRCSRSVFPFLIPSV